MKKFTALLIAIVMLFTFVALVACQTQKATVTLHFLNGNTKQVIEFNEGFRMPEDPAREGYTFGGWYTDANYTQKWVVPESLETNVHLYAKWIKQDESSVPPNPTPTPTPGTPVTPTPATDKLFVVFDLKYDRTPAAVEEVSQGAKVTFPANPKRDGYTFEGWYTAPVAGEKVTSLTAEANTVLYARWSSSGNHEHSFSSYFEYSKCTNSNCNVIGRNDSTRSFDASFVYDFNSAKQTEIDNDYNALLDSIDNANSYEKFEKLYNQFEKDLDYIGTQYQIAQVFYDAYCQNAGDIFDKNYDAVNEYFNNCYAAYYALYQTIYDSPFRSTFYQGWTKAEINEALESAASVGGSADANNEVDRIASEYNSLLGEIENSRNPNYTKLYAKFEQFVNANNKIAKQAGYDNYMDYAYVNEYNRHYTPQDVASMRSYVKQYVAPLLLKFAKTEPSDSYLSGEADKNFYWSIMTESTFTTPQDAEYFEDAKTAVNYLSSYFKYLTDVKEDINFYNAVNELFKAGNYYIGTAEGAYTYWISSANKSILYFDNSYDYDYGYTYSTAFTFAHEFGHYYNGVRNGGGEISMDHDETQSQGNEMLFLAWLKQNKASNVSKGYKVVEYYQLFNILRTIVQSTIVDEFEQAVYSNSYGTGKYKNGISGADYGNLYDEIVSSYGSGMSAVLESNYWAYVCVESAAYYISYAMSALPSLELFVKSQDSSIGLDGAKDSYFKLYTAVGQRDITTYEQALSYAGLDNPFQQSMYTTLYNYLNGYSL